MAFNVSLVHKDAPGAARMFVYSCVADAASGIISTGLERIYTLAYAPLSLTTGLLGLKPNVGAASGVSHGKVQCSGVANGDVFYLTVWGR